MSLIKEISYMGNHSFEQRYGKQMYIELMQPRIFSRQRLIESIDSSYYIWRAISCHNIMHVLWLALKSILRIILVPR